LGILSSLAQKQKGIHWSCFHKNNDANIYFDSYGLEPTKEVENILKKPYHYSNKRLQNDEEFCGVLSLYVLYRLKEGDNFENIILDMSKFLL